MAAAPKPQTPGPEPEPANPSKSLLLTHFAYKACLVTVFLVLVPLFPSLAPEFMNQAFHARSWEVLQLVFVGIAVSYGLFSKKNDEHLHKEHNNNNSPQSYVSKLLQVSSVFDDESETVIEENNMDHSKYYREQPPVVLMAKQESDGGGVVSEITQKPLLLPVRSLKQRLPENGNAVVLPSPIPWRSRSGRIENGGEGLSNGIESRSVRSENPQPSPSPSPSPSIRRLSPATSVSPVRKKAPPPPPPPPQIRRKSTLMKSNSAEIDLQKRPISDLRGGTLDSEANSVRTFRSNDSPREKLNEDEENEVLMETTDEDDSEDEFMEGRSGAAIDNDGGPDVDKKADEFIAKFREQIRQQRIESIRRSTAQRSAAGNKMNST